MQRLFRSRIFSLLAERFRQNVVRELVEPGDVLDQLGFDMSLLAGDHLAVHESGATPWRADPMPGGVDTLERAMTEGERMTEALRLARNAIGDYRKTGVQPVPAHGLPSLRMDVYLLLQELAKLLEQLDEQDRRYPAD